VSDLGNLALPLRACGTHHLASGTGFTVVDCVCDLRRSSPVGGRQHTRLGVSVTLSGTYRARGPEGDALVGAGTFLLKSQGSVQEYLHVDDGGDRSLIFEYDEPFLEDVRRSLGVDRRSFRALFVPAAPETAKACVLAREAMHSGAFADAALAVAAIAFAADWTPSARRTVADGQERRIARALRYLEDHSAEDCALETLAAVAGFSVFHFARLCRAMTGQTPRQLLIAARLRAAATALRATKRRITDVSLDAGFADLSHFTTSFRRAFGVSPRQYRG
jgi:AraC family transcriptional regulator